MPRAVRLDELGYTDVTDSLPEMKIRAGFRGIAWPYLYDGETQALSMKFGAVATPHIFIFDQERKLRYQGRIDDNQREELVKTHDARERPRRAARGPPGAGRRDAGVRVHDEVDVEGPGRRAGVGADSKPSP